MRILATSCLLLAAGALRSEAQVTPVHPRQPVPISGRLAVPIGANRLRATLLTGTSPNSGRQGQRGLLVAVNGASTSFAAGVTTVSFGPGVTVKGPVQVASPTSATATVDIDFGAPTGAHTVTVTSGTEVVSLPGGFTVTPQPDNFADVCGAATHFQLPQSGMSLMFDGVLDYAGGQDWFVINFGQAASLSLTLSAAAPGPEFDLAVLTSCASAPIASTTPGNLSKQVTIPSSGPHSVLVVVRGTHWDIAAPRFRLIAVAK